MAKGTVHNIYLLIAVEMGLFSLGVFLFWIGQLLWNGFKHRASPEVKILLSLLFAFLFIGCCDFYLITSQQGRLLLFATTTYPVSGTVVGLKPFTSITSFSPKNKF
jgi:O-antigen ligase